MPRDYGRPWNKDRVVGSCKALSQTETKLIKASLSKDNLHDLCLFLVAIDTMLRASDLLQMRVSDVQQGSGHIKTSFALRQRKTANGVFPVLTVNTQKALREWIDISGKRSSDYLFTRQKLNHGYPITIGFYRTLIKSWVASIRICPEGYSAHSLRRTKPTFMYQKGVSVELIGRLLGHKSPASTIRYLGIDEAQAKQAALEHDIFSKSSQKKPEQSKRLSKEDVEAIAQQVFIKLKQAEITDEKSSQNRKGF